MTMSRRSATPIGSGDFGKPPRVVLYARVSTRDKQDPESQLGALRQWVNSRGWHVVAEERDRISGDPSKRRGDPAGLARAFRALEERRADVLAVFAADRLVRSPTALLHLVERVQALGAHVASLQDGADLDTTTDAGELFTFLRGWYARMELRLIRSRINAGLDRARAEGKTLGRPRTVSVDAGEVAKMRAAGASWRQVAEALRCTPTSARRAQARP